MSQIGIDEMLEAGFHFGHQTSKWNPGMRRYIYSEMGGIHVIDLENSVEYLESARKFVRELAAGGGVILFVGTKKQACDTIKEVAEAAGMPYVNHRWLGGLLTNFQTLSKRIELLHELDELEKDGRLALLPTKEQMSLEAERQKLRVNLGGVRNMERLPDALVVVDISAELIAVKEADRLGIPLIALVDTNCDPNPVSYIVPGNDDSIRSCNLFLHSVGEAAKEGHSKFVRLEEAARKEAEEKARREAEESAKREEEEKQKREADEGAEAERLAKRAAEIEANAVAESEAEGAEGEPTTEGPSLSREPLEAQKSETKDGEASTQATEDEKKEKAGKAEEGK